MNVETAHHILNIGRITDLDHLHHAYRRQVKRWHPDQFIHDPAIHSLSEERLKEINQAYDVLKKAFSHQRATRKIHDKNKTNAGNRKQSNKRDKSGGNSIWKLWFEKTIHRAGRKRSKSRNATASKQRPTGDGQATGTRFERILRRETQKKSLSITRRSVRCRAVPYPHGYKPRNKSTRIEGFSPASPVTAVKPISKVGRIGDRD